jgi:hypothetical protein
MTELELRRVMIARGLSVLDGDDAERLRHFEKTLRIILPPKSVSDRTCLGRVVGWVRFGCKSERFDINVILRRIIDFALEASGPGAKNPHAVFMSILKKELEYPK